MISEKSFDWRYKADSPKEYFYMDDALKKQGVDTLVTFVDWLAEKGYIADDNEVKALLAYHLTGRCRPEGEELPVIEWHGKNGKSYELNLPRPFPFRPWRLPKDAAFLPPKEIFTAKL